MAETKVSDLSNLSAPDLADFLYAVLASGPTEKQLTLDRLLALTSLEPTARLTATTGVPVPTSDVTAGTVLYYKPCTRHGAALTDGITTTYDGTRRKKQVFQQVDTGTLSLTSGKNYDVFQKNADLSLVLSSAWTNDNTRADALTEVQGIIVASADNTYRWIGTIRASASNQIADSLGGATTQVGGKRFVWNAYNQVPRSMIVTDTADNWSYTTATVRVANGATAPLNCVEYVAGQIIHATAAAYAAAYLISSGATVKSAIGVNSTSAFSGLVQPAFNQDSNAVFAPLGGSWQGVGSLGYNYLSWLEKGSTATSSFVGDNGADGSRCGVTATIMG